jgi:hypothetical protein
MDWRSHGVRCAWYRCNKDRGCGVGAKRLDRHGAGGLGGDRPARWASLATGIVISLGTPWGLFRHYWVLISLGLTILATAVLLLHMPSVSATARIARESQGAQLAELGGDLGHAIGGLVVLLAITILNVYKPQGLTPYGWRKQQEVRAALSRQNLAGTDVRTL